LSRASVGSILASPALSPQIPLQVEGLIKRFVTLTAVDNISLTLQPGESLGLLGPNGAGKTMLIRSIVGRLLPNAGTVLIFGAAAGSQAARKTLGWIPRELAIYPRPTCHEGCVAKIIGDGVGRQFIPGVITQPSIRGSR
jgi:ABC-2 type transport system ATP-binding protein